MKINNIDFNTTVQGNGTPFIWAHGLMGSTFLEDQMGWFQWERFKETIKIIRYDARGHGSSEGNFQPEDYQWSNLAMDMIGIMDALKFDTFMAGGMSMGCATSLYVALKVPERVVGLVLVKPPTAWKTRTAQAEIYDKTAEIVEARGVEFFATLMKQQSMLPGWLLEAQPKVNDHYIENVRKFDNKILAQVLRGAKLSDLPPQKELKKIHVPVLILAWVDDAMHPLSTAQELDALLPESQLFIANGMDDVNTWPKLIEDFIKGL